MRSELNLLLSGGATRRFHTLRTIQENTVAAHSCGVALLVRLVLGAGVRAEALLYALLHDMGEYSTGDIPSPAKRALQIGASSASLEQGIIASHRWQVPELTEEERTAFKLADCFDGMLFCLSERRMGNLHVDHVFANYTAYVNELKPQGRAAMIAREISDMWKEVVSE